MTFFENTKKLVAEAAKIAQIPDEVLARLQKPDKILEFEIPVGSQKFQGWRVQHNNFLGPYKGGIRFHPDSNLDEVEALASLMTWKTSLAGLPYGGGKGAVKVDPKKLSSQELEELSRGYVRAIWQEIGPQKDVPAPDVGTTPEVLNWMSDEYAKLVGHPAPPLKSAGGGGDFLFSPGVVNRENFRTEEDYLHEVQRISRAGFTGKSIERGGSYGREVATGFGGYVVLREFLKLSSKLLVLSPESQPTVAIQGFGNVGSNLAEILARNGFLMVAISNSRQAFYNEKGIDIAEALNPVRSQTPQASADAQSHRTSNGMKNPKEFPILGKQISNQELLELPVDILVPAALENQINSENAARIRAKIVLEMANGPVTPEAEEILNKKSVEIIPDILANSGGVVGSYFEWVQNLENKQWSKEKVLQKIDEKLTEAFAAVLETKNKYNVNWRVASYIRAITRVAEAMTKKPR